MFFFSLWNGRSQDPSIKGFTTNLAFQFKHFALVARTRPQRSDPEMDKISKAEIGIIQTHL